MRRAIRLLSALAMLLLIAPRARAQGPASQPASAQTILSLTANEPVVDNEPGGPLLVREILRQAVLLAAREQLHVPTRDQALRETLRDGPGLLDININGKAPVSVRLTRGRGGDLLWQGKTNATNWSSPHDVLTILENAEAWSRTELPDTLRAAGFTGSPNVIKPSAPAPPEAETKLLSMDLLSQFAAIRMAHQSIREDGESPARLGVLVRGYANLAQLTDGHWSSMRKTFAARALLYAQRMVGTNPGTAEALWHRAYARSLVGFHAAALDDLGEADRIRRTEGPAWVKLLESLCRYDTKKLNDAADRNKAVAGVASFFAFLTLEHSGSQGAIMNVAQDASQLNPRCMRLIDAMCARTGPGMLNYITESAPQTFGNDLGENLEKLPGIPQSLVHIAHKPQVRAGSPQFRLDVINALLREGESDTLELSWATLGRLIQEVTFVQVWRRADLVASKWGIDASDFVDVALPVLGDHPYKSLIETYALNPRDPVQQRRDLLANLKPVDADFAMFPMLDILRATGLGKDEAGRELWRKPLVHADATAYDQEAIIERYADLTLDFKSGRVKTLREVSPHSPLALAMIIRDDWPVAEPMAKAWEQQYGSHPAVALALGDKYARLKKWDDAERCYRNYIAVAQDQAGYWALAEMYKRRGNDAAWIATLSAFLEQPDFGLQHAQTRVRLAEYYMDKDDYARAVPYAEAAAQGGAQWARDCAARAREGLKDWPHAEQWVKENADHYTVLDQWLKWCLRTGHGDLAGAQQMARRYPKVLAGRTDPQSLFDVAGVYLMLDEKKAALDPLRQMFDTYHDAWAGLHLALLADESGDTNLRDTALATVSAGNGAHGPRGDLVALAKMVKDVYVHGPGATLDAKAIDKIESSLNPFIRSDFDYFVARFCDRFAQKDDAQRYYIRSVTGPEPSRIDLVLAAVQLRPRGIEPMNLPREKPHAAAPDSVEEQ